MKKIIYTRPEDGGLSIVVPNTKEKVEEILGPITDEEYEAHVRKISIPDGALNVRDIDEEDIPLSREFRNAWCDVTPSKSIDIDCDKAKEIQLNKLRFSRNETLAESDVLITRAMENGEDITDLKAYRQQLRDITTPLKALKTAEIYNDEGLLDKIRSLGTFTPPSLPEESK